MTLNARDLVELAALLSQHGPVIIAGDFELAPDALEQYWVASKCRLDRWLRALQPRVVEHNLPQNRHAVLPGVVEEIFTTEVLTRVWTAILAARGKRHDQSDGEMIARSVMISHMEARNRALKLLLHGTHFNPEQAVELNRLRRRSERWSDVLVGRLLQTAEVGVYAVDSERAREFALDMHYQAGLISERQVWGLLMASLRAAFRQSMQDPSPNADLNERVAAGILSGLGPQLYDDTGQFHSLRLFRYLNDIPEQAATRQHLFPSEKLYPQVEPSAPVQELPPTRTLPSNPRFGI